MRLLYRILHTKWLLIAVLATLTVVSGYMSVSATPDPTNDIIKDGFSSASDFIKKVKNNGPYDDLQSIYAYKYYNLTSDDYARFAANAQRGYSYPDGRIVVDGRTVGTNAKSLGRNEKTHSTPVKIDGTTYYESKIGDVTNYRNNVTVLFDKKGNVQTIVMDICGNPIRVTPNNPSYECDLLNAKSPLSDKTYQFWTSAPASNGASIKKVVYDFGDGTATDTETSATTKVTHTYKKAGTYTAKVTVYVNVPGNQVYTIAPAGDCVKKITIKPDEKPAIEVTKTVSGPVKIDKNFSYQITVTNKGNVALKQVAITDTPEDGIVLMDSNGHGLIHNNIWTYTISSLAVDEAVTYNLTAKVPSYKAGLLKNTVCVDTPTIPGKPDDCSSVTVEVPKPGEVQATETVKVNEVRVCDVEKRTIVWVPEANQNDARYDVPDSKSCSPYIPSTGPVEVISTVAGLGSFAGAGYYWRASRRQLFRSGLKH